VAVVGLMMGFWGVSAHADVDDDAVLVDHDMGLCAAPEGGKSFVRVSVEGLKDLEGNIRVQVYGPTEEDFLEKGKKLVRIDVKTESDGQEICVPMPGLGDFTLVVMHDRNANGKADFFTEGFGFSNNPKLGLGKPDVEDVVFTATEGVTDMPVNLKYIFGADEEQKKKRRQLRRR
jgi:uncharacterized protein (DUF2141 family)